ncbi:MAG: dipeptidyl-peptidase 3 family protein, partial [Myxococcaceae bacterium]
ELGLAARLLKDASELITQPTLKAFLSKRAESFMNNDYYPSDVAWMELDASIEPTIGPYEVYEDGWFNYKAAFESFIALRDDAETQKLAKFSHHLQDIENHLPIDDALKNPKLGALAPIRVVNSIFSSGDGNKGVQTAAYNLPNDERVTKEKGTKRVMLKNVQRAKFDSVLLPIAKVALSKADQKNVGFESFFTHILMHELMHGLGPHSLVVKGRETTVRQELQESSSAIEEAKADVAGLFALQYLVDKGVLEKSLEKTMYTTFLASAFRTLRFGVDEAHGRGMAIQTNFFLDRGGFKVVKDGTFSVDVPKMKEAVSALTRELMTLQSKGDRAKAEELIGTLGVIRPEVKKIIDQLKNVPIDIQPRYVSAKQILEGK